MNSAKQHTDDIAAGTYAGGGANADGGGKYSPFQLARKYIRYYLRAANGKGHGIHSPFVFDLVINVLNDSRVFPEYAAIERLRRQLESDPTILSIEDMGAGSASGATTLQRSISDIARRMAKPKKLGQLLFRIARYYQPERVLELGTSLGLSTAYLAAGSIGTTAGGMGKMRGATEEIGTAEAKIDWGGISEERMAGMTGQAMGKRDGAGKENTAGNTGEAAMQLRGMTEDRRMEGGTGEVGGVKIFTIEGASEVAVVAGRNFRLLGLENIECTIGNFDQVLEGTLARAGRIDLAFIDGNHRLEPTLRYFDALYGQLSSSAVVIFDDIHWSQEMEEAWESIKKDPRVYLSVDLFFIGLIFFRDNFKVKQDFVIRF